MNKSKKLSAQTLRNILIVTIGLLIIASIAGFVYADHLLTSFASDVNTANNDAASSSQHVSQLLHLRTEMDNNQVAVTRAQNIVGDSKYYQYQNQIINDLTSYAEAAGFHIDSFSFEANTTPTGVPVAPVTPLAGTGAAAPAVPAGLKISTAIITLPKGLSYATVMTFLKSIEQNLTKMEVTGVSFSLDPTTNNNIITQPITIGVYTR